jgi:hypothetical protein
MDRSDQRDPLVRKDSEAIQTQGTGRLAYHARDLMVFETAALEVLERLRARDSKKGKNQHVQPSQWRYAAVPDHR